MALDIPNVCFADAAKYQSVLRIPSYTAKGVLSVRPGLFVFKGAVAATEIRDPRHLDLTRPRLPWVGLLCMDILLYLVYLGLDSLRGPGEGIDLLFHRIPSFFFGPDSPLPYAVLVITNVFMIFLWSRERWVQVAYDDAGKLRYAYFTDGGANGLSMYFGGAERLRERIKAGLESELDDLSSPTSAPADIKLCEAKQAKQNPIRRHEIPPGAMGDPLDLNHACG